MTTTKVPFYDQWDIHTHTQIDGISKGSVLGPTFSNIYMSNLENKIFIDIKKKTTYICMVCWWYPYSSW